MGIAPWAPWVPLRCRLSADFRLVDAFRVLFPQRRAYTWSSRGVSCRLDRFYVSECLKNKIKDCDIDFWLLSDHRPIKLNLDLEGFPSRANSYWKLNTSLLADPSLRDQVKEFWFNCVRNDTIPLAEWWDNFKNGVRNILRRFGSSKTKETRANFHKLNSELSRLMRNQSANFARISEIEVEIKRYELQRLNGAVIRSKINALENNERSTRHFVGGEHVRATKKLFTKLVSADGVVQTTRSGISRSIVDYYSTLYTSEPTDAAVQDRFLSDLPVLNEDDLAACEGELTVDECYRSLRGMEDHKSSGLV